MRAAAALLPKHNGGYCELVFEGDKLVDLIPTERPEPEPTMEDLKNQLAETDYRIIKSVEYQLVGWNRRMILRYCMPNVRQYATKSTNWKERKQMKQTIEGNYYYQKREETDADVRGTTSGAGRITTCTC